MAKQICAFITFIFMMCWCAASAPGIYVVEMEICTDPNAQRNPDVEYNFIVWQDNRNGDWDIYAYDLERQAEYAICTADGNQTNPSVGLGNILDEPIIAWQDDRNGNNDIYGYKLIDPYFDLAIGTEIEICTDPCDQQNPDSMGSYVCWQDYRNGNWDIYGKSYDIEPNEFVICDDISDQINPAADWYYVAWQDNRGGDWDIYGFDLDDQNEVAVCTEDGNQTNPSCSGNLGFAWQDDRNGGEDIYGLLCTDIPCSGYAEVGVCTAPGTQINTGLSRYVVVWQDDRSGTWDIYGYKVDNIYFGQEFIISAGAGDRVSPAIDVYDNDRVVWQDSRNGNDDIYAAYLCLKGNDNCNECAIELFDGQPYFGSTQNMSGTYTPPDYEPLTSTCGFNDFDDTWHIYQPAVGGPVTITTEGSSIDTILAVFNSCYSHHPDHQQPIELACNDDYCLENAGSKVTLDAVKGKTYYIRVSGFNDQTGDYRIVVKRGAATDPIKSDLNGNGNVDWFDFSIFASEWLMSDTE